MAILLNRLRVLMDAIAKREGFGHAGDVPTRLNNPGDLVFAHQRDAAPVAITGRDGKMRVYASFPNVNAGWYALEVQIRLDARRGKSLAEFIAGYAPASDDNDPASYLSFVMRELGTQNSNEKLADIIAA